MENHQEINGNPCHFFYCLSLRHPARWRTRDSTILRRLRELAAQSLTVLAVACLFTGAAYLFLVQLATYGW